MLCTLGYEHGWDSPIRHQEDCASKYWTPRSPKLKFSHQSYINPSIQLSHSNSRTNNDRSRKQRHIRFRWYDKVTILHSRYHDMVKNPFTMGPTKLTSHLPLTRVTQSSTCDMGQFRIAGKEWASGQNNKEQSKNIPKRRNVPNERTVCTY